MVLHGLPTHRLLLKSLTVFQSCRTTNVTIKKKIILANFWPKMALFAQTTCRHHIFCRKLAKIAEYYDQNIDP
jgi:hypothetical protein